MNWSNNDDLSDGGIDVERSPDGGSTWNSVNTGLSTSTSSYTDNSGNSGTTYSYRIERNTDHASATSNTASSTYKTPISIDGDQVREVTIDGEQINSITIDGDQVF